MVVWSVATEKDRVVFVFRRGTPGGFSDEGFVVGVDGDGERSFAMCGVHGLVAKGPPDINNAAFVAPVAFAGPIVARLFDFIFGWLFVVEFLCLIRAAIVAHFELPVEVGSEDAGRVPVVIVSHVELADGQSHFVGDFDVCVVVGGDVAPLVFGGDVCCVVGFAGFVLECSVSDFESDPGRPFKVEEVVAVGNGHEWSSVVCF